MSWYLRKYIKVGPFRLNLSKSGIGISAGVKGARIGINSKGIYTHAGRYGLYHRKSISWSRLQSYSNSRLKAEPSIDAPDRADSDVPLTKASGRTSLPPQPSSVSWEKPEPALSKSLELDISLVRDKSTSTVLLCVAGLCVLLAFVLPVTWPVQLLPLAAAGFFLISTIYLTLRFRRDLRHSNRLYEMLRQAYFSRDRESFADRQEEIREYIKSRR